MASRPVVSVQPALLFRYSLYCRYRRSIWGKTGIRLEPRFRLPCFTEIEGQPLFAELRAAWNMTGISFDLTVGKRTEPKRRTRPHEQGDALRIWINTRDAAGTRRPGQFCHHFVFYRFGDPTSDLPAAHWVKLRRATTHPQPVSPSSLQVMAQTLADGYRLEAHIAADALTGFDPKDHPALGFSYAVSDCEHGWQTLSKKMDYRLGDDPSLWETLELVND